MIPDFGLEDPRILYLYVGAFLLAHLLLFAYIYVRNGTGGGSAAADPGDPGASGIGTDDGPRVPDIVPPEQLPPVDSDSPVQCSHCGAENEPEFRYCRNCVAEVGRGLSSDTPGTSQSQRRPF